MAGHQPMGPGGVDIDMTTGRPAVRTPGDQKNQATEHLRNTIKESIDLAVDLQTTPVIRVLVKKYEARLTALASQDPECKALEDILTSLHFKLETAPNAAKKRLQQLMGIQALQFLKEGEGSEGH